MIIKTPVLHDTWRVAYGNVNETNIVPPQIIMSLNVLDARQVLAMEDSYSSTFESENTLSCQDVGKERTMAAREKAAGCHAKNYDKNLDLKLLSEAVRELQRLNHERLMVGSAVAKRSVSSANRTFTSERLNQINQQNGVLLRKIVSQKFRPVASANKAVSFQPSAFINRRKQQKQIEHDNLVIDVDLKQQSQTLIIICPDTDSR